MVLRDRRVLLIMGGGIAAYKSLDLIRRLKERDAAVRCVLTKAAQEFITPLAAGALTGERAFTDLFDAQGEFDVGHIRLARETEAIERRVAGRSHVIARTFDRVCRVLESLGYLTGDTVTPDGRQLGRLYTELDLLAAECLRRGLWDDLSPAELAACVSALSFESRQADDVQPPQLPKGRVPACHSCVIIRPLQVRSACHCRGAILDHRRYSTDAGILAVDIRDWAT